MAKKLNAKQRREAQQAEKRKTFEKLAVKAKAEKNLPEISEKEEKKPVLIKKKKTSPKAAGLKSAFILSPNEVLMTAFGRGNKAIIEKQIKEKEVISLNSHPSFDVAVKGPHYEVTGRSTGTADDPNYSNTERASHRGDKLAKAPGMDMIGMKDSLEKRFFKTEKPFADNIHIQLIYSILDIEKIMAPHVNNIAYVVDNLRRDGGDYDLIGNLGLGYSYSGYEEPASKPFTKLISSSQRAYLGDALLRQNLKKGEKETDEDRKNYFYSLSLIGEARQMLFHGAEGKQAAIYTLGEDYDDSVVNSNPEKLKDILKARKEAREVLDRIYENRINSLNMDFLATAKKDLAVLFRVYGAKTKEEKAELLKEFYIFTVRKDQKNMGFSLKKLREAILSTPEGIAAADRCEQSMRRKFTKTFGFAQSIYYADHPEKAEEIVNSLRAAQTDEEKEKIYSKEAVELWKEIRSVVLEHILPVMDPSVFEDLPEDKDISLGMLRDVRISEKADYFSKLVYLLTRFMDGKEINDMLTQLISKFESIGSFYDILTERGLEREFSKEYAFFANSWIIAEELRTINSFARMQGPENNAKKIMFIEAAQILGFKGTEEELDNYVEFFLTKDRETSQSISRKLWGVPLPGKGFRNFIANNVIESSRFKYIVRYADPKKVRKIAENDQIIKLALNEIPDAQIERYYLSCIDTKPTSADIMRDQLRLLIKKLDFTDFADVRQQAKTPGEADYKQKKQNIIRLYLTVLYLVVKNLVRVNSRYALAFHCFERDYQLILGKKWNRSDGERHYYDLTQKFISEKRLNSKSRKYLEINIRNSDSRCIRIFRNGVAHLNAVSNIDQYVSELKKTDSYFALYHYIIQRYLMDKYQIDSKDEDKDTSQTKEYFDSVRMYGKYRMDFVKALNTPFGYNLARYKNLSIEGLFDKDRPGDAGSGEPEGE